MTVSKNRVYSLGLNAFNCPKGDRQGITNETLKEFSLVPTIRAKNQYGP